jgi:glycerophosphoryl diester phosphodiesterase
MPKWLWFPLLLALSACVPAATNPNPYITPQKVWVIAHQGGEGVWPSNTMLAFQQAVRLGVDMLDTDIHLTKDGILVTIHDDSVDRTTNGKGKVRDLTLAEIKALDAGYYWPQFATDSTPRPFRGQGIRIATLEEAFQAFPTMPWTIEIKADGLAQPFCELMRRYKMTDKVIVASFRDSAMQEFRRTCPEVMTSMTESEIRPLVLMNLFGIGHWNTPPGRALQVPVQASGLEVVTPSFIAMANRMGLTVQPWTINEEAEMRRLVAMGVHGINTDRPDLLMKVLGR